MKILALGPEGTNGHEAATRVIKQITEASRPEIELCDSHAIVFERASKELCLGIVPIENSIAGLVADTIHGFWLQRPIGWSGTSVLGEVELPIEHVLVMRQGALFGANTPVLSHPQALSQCRENLQQLGLNNLIPTKSTAGAGKLIATDEQHANFAALVPPFAARVYGLQILKSHMEDVSGNTTRFHVLGYSLWPPTCDCKTALIFWTQDRPRALMNALWAISADNVNMSSIHSLPLGTPGHYAFYVEFNEHAETKEGVAIMERLKTVTDRVLWLGSFPQEQSVLERNYGSAQRRW